jgi:hypothetical protein
LTTSSWSTATERGIRPFARGEEEGYASEVWREVIHQITLDLDDERGI